MLDTPLYLHSTSTVQSTVGSTSLNKFLSSRVYETQSNPRSRVTEQVKNTRTLQELDEVGNATHVELTRLTSELVTERETSAQLLRE